MNTKKDIGSQIKSLLENEVISPKDAVWINLEKELKAKKKKKKTAFFWLSSGLLGLGLLLFTLFSDIATFNFNAKEDNTILIDKESVTKKVETNYNSAQTKTLYNDSLGENVAANENIETNVKPTNIIKNKQTNESLLTEIESNNKTSKNSNSTKNKAASKTKAPSNSATKNILNTNKKIKLDDDLFKTDIAKNDKAFRPKNKITQENTSQTSFYTNNIKTTINSTKAPNLSNYNTNKVLHDSEVAHGNAYQNTTDSSKNRSINNSENNSNIKNEAKNNININGGELQNENPLENKTERLAASNKNDKTETSTEKKLKPKNKETPYEFSIFPHASVDYYGSFNQKFKNNSTLNYGVYLSLRASEKLIFRSGINKLEFKYNSNSNDPYQIQKLSFIEIPLEIRQKIIDKKVSTSVVYSFSYLILENASLTFNQNTISNRALFVNNNVSFNLGLSFQTKLFKKAFFNLEPIFKYHMIPDHKINDTPVFSASLLIGIEYQF